MKPIRPLLARHLRFTTVPLVAALALTACGGGNGLVPLPTLDGAVPLIIGHRGLPGLYPEETLPSYQGAVDAGADSLEEDLHLTKDCVLVARHNPWLSDNTNIVVALVAKERFKVKCVVVRLLDPARADFYRERGLHVVCPTQHAIAVINDAIRASQEAA